MLDWLEESVLGLLLSAPSIAPADLFDSLYTQFDAELTPDYEAIMACLTSYGWQDEAGNWRLRDEDVFAGRCAEIEYMQQCVEQLGDRLGLIVHTGLFDDFVLDSNEIVWEFSGGRPYLWRIVSDTALLHLEVNPSMMRHRPYCFLVLPGGRSSLVMFRQRTSPLWREAIAQYGWRFVKYRHLRRLMREEVIDRSSLLTIVGLDPIVEQAGAQMPLFLGV